MKNLLSAGLIALALLPGLSWADHRHHDDDDRRYDYARVVDVDPIVERQRVRVEREVCWDEDVLVHDRRPRGDLIGAALVGGVIGGVVGHEVGDHRHAAAPVLGAAIGAAVGHGLVSQRSLGSRYVTERRCAVEPDFEYHEAVIGYEVSYRYRGRVYHTRTDRHPGKRIRVRVDVTPTRWQG